MFRRLPVVLLLSVSSACGVSPANRLGPLEGAPRVELFALDPISASVKPAPPGVELFHDYPVLGRADLSDPERASELARLLRRGIESSDGSVALCFNPRHGVRVERDGQSLELVICFECNQIYIHTASAPSATQRETVATASSIEPDVTRIFEGLGLRIAAQ